MEPKEGGLIAGILLAAVLPTVAAVHYVDLKSTNSTPPYSTWATAANVIQDAIDAALPGDEVVVTNGIYAVGGRAIFGTMTNRVSVDKPLTLRSVNGPQFTLIEGFQLPGTTNGDGAIRCVYLTNGANLFGFTLTNGATRVFFGDDTQEHSGGGVWCASTTAVVSNCVMIGNSAGLAGGGAWSGTLYDCVLTGNFVSSSPYGSDGNGGGVSAGTLFNCTLAANSAVFGGGGAHNSTLVNCALLGNSTISTMYGVGGGAFGGALTNCTLLSNSAFNGGGAYGSTLSGCTLTNNTCVSNGGGAGVSTLYNCVLSSNSAYWGGGVSSDPAGNPSTLHNCTLTGNSASWGGGGAVNSILGGCVLKGNSATGTVFGGGDGGGAHSAILNNCTLVENSALSAGGVFAGTLNNCIVTANVASNSPNYTFDSLMNYCCTSPEPTNGMANIVRDPQFLNEAAGNLRLQSNSPCINAGNNNFVSDIADLDGNPRIAGGTADMGAYEFQNPASQISYNWLQQYGLPTDGSADFSDPDQDGLNNWQEWVCGTDPTNALSALRLLPLSSSGTNVLISWESVAGISYFLERSTNLAAHSAFILVSTNLFGKDGTTTYTDTNFAGAGPLFYRVGVVGP